MSDLSYHQVPEGKSCKKGHLLSADNIYTYTLKGKEYHKCRQCHLDNQKRRDTAADARRYDSLAEQVGQLQNQLECAMPWERDTIKQRIKKLYQKSH